ncbi:MAG: hypothetical protein N2201_03710 [candidate division WOR-3 bacterium]|nr:hypothetical protein [candidate division WOR-3 bacterium]
MKRLIIIIIILFISIAGIFYGVKKGEPVETETVGSVMCLSCMGLQQ